MTSQHDDIRRQLQVDYTIWKDLTKAVQPYSGNSVKQPEAMTR